MEMQLGSVPMTEEVHMKVISEGVRELVPESEHIEMEFGPVHMTDDERRMFFDNVIKNLEEKFGSGPMRENEHRKLDREGRRNKWVAKEKIILRVKKNKIIVKRFSYRK